MGDDSQWTPHAVILWMIARSQKISLDNLLSLGLHQTLNSITKEKILWMFIHRLRHKLAFPVVGLPQKLKTNPSLMVCVLNFINNRPTCILPGNTYLIQGKKNTSTFHLWSKSVSGITVNSPSERWNFCELYFHQLSGTSFPMIKCCRVWGEKLAAEK